MDYLASDRLILRGWLMDDWRDLLEISIDWKSQPGPEFDKFPVTEEEWRKDIEYFAKQDNYYAIYLKSASKAIGFLSLNGINENGQMDLGHIIHSQYQDNDIDREALNIIVAYIFRNHDVKAVVTNNSPDEKQNRPLYSL
jgi:RimJ/RimL family protein N-acetyltransferase